MSNSLGSTHGIGNVFTTIWKGMLALGNDPHPDVANMAQIIIDEIKSRVQISTAFLNDSLKESRSDPSYSEPSSPATHPTFVMSESPPVNGTSSNLKEKQQNDTPSGNNFRSTSSHLSHPITYSSFLTPYQRKRKIFGRGPNKINEDSNHDEAAPIPRAPLVKTDYIEWCIKNFSEYCMKFLESSDPESTSHHEREWRTIRNYHLKKEAKEELSKMDPCKINEQVFLEKHTSVPCLLKFHPYEPHLIVAEKESFSVWLWENQNNLTYNCGYVAPHLLGTFSNLNSSSNRITSLQLVNPHDITTLMLACDDGSVRAWRIHNIQDINPPQPQLVTAFQIFSESSMSQKAAGTLIEWNQALCELYAAGDSKVIRIWDPEKEMKVGDIPTGVDCSITSLSTDGANLICAGCQFGNVRIYDKRVAHNDSRVLTFRDHCNWITNAYIYPENAKHFHVISGSLSGDVKFWDKRLSNAIKTINVSQGMTTMSVHPEADIFAW